MKKFSTILLVLLIALATFACDDKPKQGPHESTITAFGRTIKVKGDASISTADFNIAKGKLEEAMTTLSNGVPEGPQRDRFNTMLNRTGFSIIIETGNASPDANANKSMTIGVDYLRGNDASTIVAAMMQKVVVAPAFLD